MTSQSKPPKKVTQPSKGRGLSKAEKIAIPIIIIIAIWGVYSIIQPGSPTSTTLTQVSHSSTNPQGTAAPDFTLPVVGPNGPTGQTLTLSSLRGKVVLLEFMEPWCSHCQNMAPVLESLYGQYGSSVAFVSVSGPYNGATADTTAQFIKSYGSSWTYVFDGGGSAMGEYQVSSTPTFFIIGKDGSILGTYQGEQTYDTLSAALTQAS
jgi:thiol-disulfide isomerase/thioredoxin